MSEAPPASPSPARFDRVRLANLAILAVYAVLLALVIPEHEPWTDEAQSWLLARDSSLGELLTTRLHYEGTPALWHLLLMIPAKLGLPYESMQLLGAASATGAVALLVFLSPFPLWLRALLPFSYFLGYQYAVVARNYCLLALLLFAAAFFARRRRQNYGPFALMVGLVSHVSLHAALFAGAIWLTEVVAAGLLLRREGMAAARPRLLALGLLAVNFGFVLVQIWPAADILIRPPFDNAAISLAIAAQLTREAFAVHLGLSLLALAGLLPLLWQRRVLGLFVLGLGFVYALLCLRYFALWHTGVAFVFVLFCLWLALDVEPASESSTTTMPMPWARPVALAALTLIAVMQIPGTIAAGRRDVDEPYSSSRAAAQYLQERGIDRRVLHGFDFHSYAVQPYFDRNIFANFRARRAAAYWVWDLAALRDIQQLSVLAGDPEFILIRRRRTSLPPEQLTERGYVLEKSFPGHILWRLDATETDEMLLYRRKDLPESQPLAPKS